MYYLLAVLRLQLLNSGMERTFDNFSKEKMLKQTSIQPKAALANHAQAGFLLIFGQP